MTSHVGELGPCLEYRGPLTNGYGHPRLDGHQVLLHRWIVEHVEGVPLELGEVVMHLCDNPPCFRYSHLRRATQQANLLDCVAKGRHRYGRQPGEANGAVKLSADQVLAIRATHAAGGVTYIDLAQQYGVCNSTIGNIVHRRKWAHL